MVFNFTLINNTCRFHETYFYFFGKAKSVLSHNKLCFNLHRHKLWSQKSQKEIVVRYFTFYFPFYSQILCNEILPLKYKAVAAFVTPLITRPVRAIIYGV